ncbi:flagellar basal body P-ring formation protein FlgA [Citrobacter amalonaticus]|uniref:flagellar basal body P-ring formation chaperone FlgA n=1 Tax=Citrobacter amalonaticus TaxID=35703 RepID=UPI001903CDEE|nr:flagellar basal body P-ring formation chaperone FlgA [Citrobacter amalonaticus]MBJ9260439.1 flagellar basal body P-ring formation protein FlgA [Citrobacter amalonaticus]
MKLAIHNGKSLFPLVPQIILMLALPAQAAVHPVQHSAREQINAQVLAAASQTLDALAQQQQWHDYRFAFNVFIPTQVASAAPCPREPQVTLASAADMALTRMNFAVSCPGNSGWEMSVAVRPDVFVPVVMAKSLIERNTVLTPDDLQMKSYNISGQRNGLLMRLEDAVGLTSKRTLQPGKPLTRAALIQPLLVKRDQPVTIVSRMEGITASMPGVALKNGRKGDIIKIRNTSSQRVVSGVVEEEGIVATVNAEQ